MAGPVRKGLIYSGVCYHHALRQPGEPLAAFEPIFVGDLATTDLEAFDVLLAPRSSDAEALFARRHQIARYLDGGGVLIAFGELWTDWFPGCRWQPECAADIREPVKVADHALFTGLSAHDLHWHPTHERWCCHGHLQAPPGAEVLVANADGDAWTYIDRVSTAGTILASTNLDPDTHAFHGSAIARDLLERIVRWGDAEAQGLASRPAARSPKIAGLYSGVHFQHGFYSDPEFQDQFVPVPILELPGLALERYAAVWIPRESNQEMLLRERDRLRAYLEGGGTLVSFEEVVLPWLPRATWEYRKVDVETLSLATHPLVDGLTPDQVRWHAHGIFAPYPEAELLIRDGQGDAVLYIDERGFAGRILAGTLDPDCHAGFGSGRTRPLLRRILNWTLAPANQGASAPVPAATTV